MKKKNSNEKMTIYEYEEKYVRHRNTKTGTATPRRRASYSWCSRA